MTWESFYDGFYGWSDAGQRKIALMQKDFGDEDEVAEIAMSFIDEEIASKFINRAITANVQFSADSLVELADFIDEATLTRALRNTKAVFSQDQLATLDGYVDEETIEALTSANAEMPESVFEQRQTRRSRRQASQSDSLTGSPLLDAFIGIKFIDWLFGSSGKNKH